MSMQAVEAVLLRAISDKAFAALLFSKPEQALAGLDLSAEEAASLKCMTHAEFDALSMVAPEERKSSGDRWGLTSNHNETFLKVQRSLSFNQKR